MVIETSFNEFVKLFFNIIKIVIVSSTFILLFISLVSLILFLLVH